MSEGKSQFRGTPFGGFNRQDVLDYLESSTKASEEQLETVRAELEETKQANETMAQKLEDIAQQFTEKQEENEQLSHDLEVAQTELQQKRTVLTQAEEELQLLRAKVAELEPLAAAYTRVKDRTATIELEAHERAQIAMDEASEEEKRIHERSAQWACQVQESFNQLRTDVDATIAHVSSEIYKICHSFGKITAEFEGHDDALKDLIQQCEDYDGEH